MKHFTILKNDSSFWPQKTLSRYFLPATSNYVLCIKVQAAVWVCQQTTWQHLSFCCMLVSRHVQQPCCLLKQISPSMLEVCVLTISWFDTITLMRKGLQFSTLCREAMWFGLHQHPTLINIQQATQLINTQSKVGQICSFSACHELPHKYIQNRQVTRKWWLWQCMWKSCHGHKEEKRRRALAADTLQ